MARSKPNPFQLLVDRITAEAKVLCSSSIQVDQTDDVPRIRDLDDEDNDGLLIETTILYCDMRGSTDLVSSHQRGTSARVFKSFLNALVDVGSYYGGEARAFDGDRILMLFPPGDEDVFRRAIQTALGFQCMVERNLRPLYQANFGCNVQCGVGVAFGKMLAIRVGGRGKSKSEIVWIGKPAFLAAKLSDQAGPGEIMIDQRTYGGIPDGFKSPNEIFGWHLYDSVWSERSGSGGKPVYCTGWESLLECVANSDDEDN